MTASDQVTVQGLAPVSAAWMLVLFPWHIVPPPVTVAMGRAKMVWVRTGEVLGLKVVPSLKTAVMECDPDASVEVANVAWPELRLMVARDVAPSLKVTVPEGVPEPGARVVTVAVKVTDWPKPSSVPVPRVVEPSLKVTAPVGVVTVPVTVAVKVTVCPKTGLVCDEVTVVELARPLTVTLAL